MAVRKKGDVSVNWIEAQVFVFSPTMSIRSLQCPFTSSVMASALISLIMGLRLSGCLGVLVAVSTICRALAMHVRRLGLLHSSLHAMARLGAASLSVSVPCRLLLPVS